jgi:serine protease Do
VIDAAKGYVLTSDHVLRGASRVMVIGPDGRERPASQVRRDPKSGLALLIVDGQGLGQAEWGDSDVVEMGDWVLAAGRQAFRASAFVSAGIVSGKANVPDLAFSHDLIQTDAVINAENSGGPLVNLRGEVVGINVGGPLSRVDVRLNRRPGRPLLGIDAALPASSGPEGIGVAIPAALARRVAAELTTVGQVRRAYLGVNIQPADRATAERLDRPGAVVINGVQEGSPAAQAGLRPGDIILDVEGRPLQGLAALRAAIEVGPTDKPLTLTIERDGQRREVQVTPGPQPESLGPSEARPGRAAPRARPRPSDLDQPPGPGRPPAPAGANGVE